MPVYGTVQAGGIAAVGPGDSYTLFNAETLTAPVASVPYARAMGPGQSFRPQTFTVDFESSPTASITVQGSNTEVAANYISIGTAMTAQHSSQTIIDNFTFYRMSLTSQDAGGKVTAKVQG